MPNLAAWQWGLYAQGHTTRGTLAIHIVTVPLFIAGALGLIGALAAGSTVGAAVCAACMFVPLAAQGRAHKSEPVASVPFTGPWNFVARFLVEQFFTFPRYVLTGGWLRAWRAASRRPADS